VPLYVYRCKQCGQRLEKIQHFKSKPEVVCPKCKGELERVLTAPTFKFKGSGWYVNDYGGKSAGSRVCSCGRSGCGEDALRWKLRRGMSCSGGGRDGQNRVIAARVRVLFPGLMGRSVANIFGSQ